MGKIVLAFSMSLDGFIAGPDVSDAEPMGRNGERLHDWMFKDHPDRAKDEAVVKQRFADTGAVVLGKRTFDLGVSQWNDTPYPAPSFVLTHENRESLPMTSASFTFVNDGIESAVSQAQEAAGDRDVVVMGADTAQQVIKAGLADELFVTLVPVLLGGGTRLFDNIGEQPIELTSTRQVDSSVVTHFWFSVDRKQRNNT